MSEVTILTEILGKTISTIDAIKGRESVLFTFTDGLECKFEHYQDCCEHVYLADIIGDLDDLIGDPLLMAEETSNREEIVELVDYHDESHTWTFYKFATIKGYVTFRWLGTSNGYYSESVNWSIKTAEDLQKEKEALSNRDKELQIYKNQQFNKRRPLKKQLKVLKAGKIYKEDIVVFGDLFIKGNGEVRIPNLTVYKGTVHVNCKMLTITGYLNIDHLHFHGTKAGIQKD